ncbi:MAG: RNA polymerase sigma factor [Fibrobacter sp.]|nr:RNA polymerase sigma factor [Fibrobacter sp.]
MKVYRVCYRYVKSHQIALELRQEVFFRVFKKYHTLRNLKAVNSWLYRIAVNISLDYLRSQKRRPILISLGDSGSPQHEVKDNTPTADKQLELESELNYHLRELDNFTREVVDLRYVMGMTLREIAKHKGVSTRQVRNYMSSFDRKMRKYRRVIGHNGQRKGNFAKCPYSYSSYAQPLSLRRPPGNRGLHHTTITALHSVREKYG